MRYTKQISTGKLIETQGGGNPDNPVHLAALKDNALASGIAESDIEVAYADDDVVAGWLKKEKDDAMTYVDRRHYPPIGDQLDALWKGGDDAAAMKVIVDKVKSDNPKG